MCLPLLPQSAHEISSSATPSRLLFAVPQQKLQVSIGSADDCDKTAIINNIHKQNY